MVLPSTVDILQKTTTSVRHADVVNRECVNHDKLLNPFADPYLHYTYIDGQIAHHYDAAIARALGLWK